MKLLCLFALLLALVSASSNDSNDSRDIDADVKRIRIDPALRKALLRALRHLKERQEEDSEALNDSNTTEENFSTTILDEILEESTSRDRSSTSIKYHTYTADSETDKGDNEIIKTIIITKPRTTLSPPKEDLLNENVPDPIRERENDVETNQVARSVASGSVNNLENAQEIKPSEEKKSPVFTTAASISTTTQVTPAVTTTTLPTTTIKVRTHNADGENIEKVKSEDVKIYQAPLVAAFTVQQDQLGVPRNVIPLLQTPPKKVPANFQPSTPMAPTVKPPSQIQQTPKLTAPAATATPINLNTQALEEKTRLLEQQLIALQTQQRIQEQLLRSKLVQEQQILLQQQQQLQQQRLRLEEETRLRLQKFDEEQRLFRQQQQQLQQQQQQLKFQQQQQQQQPQLPQHQQQQQQLQQQLQQQQHPQIPQPHLQLPQQQQQLPFNPFGIQQLPVQQPPQQFQQQKPNFPQNPQPQFFQELPRNTPAVQFIPSVSLPGRTIPISVEQQLPFKEPVDFQPIPLKSTVVEQVQSISPQFPIIPPSPPQLSKQQLLPLKPFQPFGTNPAPSLNPIDQQLPQLQRNRVFRHEASTGNFGFNQLPPQQSNAPFRPSQPIPLLQQNNDFQPLRSDSQLQNLLVQSGITSRSAEDFNIITKVLALNHGIPQSSSQQMFAKLSPEQQQLLLFRKK